MKSKKCTKCKELLPLLAFRRDMPVRGMVTFSICNLCRDIATFQSKRKHTAKQSQLAREKVLDELKTGMRKRCNCCKRPIKIDSITTSGICKACYKRFMELKEIEVGFCTTKTIKELKKREESLTAEEKANKANNLDNMIAEFLAKQNKDSK